MGKRETKARQSLKTEGNDEDYKEMAAAMPCKRKAQIGTTKVAAKQETASKKILKRSMVE